MATQPIAAGKPLEVPISRIERYEDQPRKYFNKKSLEGLADSIEDSSLQQPIKICAKPDAPDHYILIDGERRWRAFRLIAERTGGDPLVPSFVDEIRDPEEHFRKSFISNLHREDLTPLDEAAAYLHMKEAGESIATIAKISDKSVSHVTGYLLLNSLPDEVKELMSEDLPKERRLRVTQAIDIARGIPESEVALRIELAQEAIERGLGVQETKGLVQIKTGERGYGVGGRLRKPSDDYRQFESLLSRSIAHFTRFRVSMNIRDLYEHRPEGESDRARDAKSINRLVEMLTELKDGLED